MVDWDDTNKERLEKLLKMIPTATEKDFRDFPFEDFPFPTSQEWLMKIINALTKINQDYGTCVYAMSFAALAASHYMSHVVGATGFQASCADMDYIRRSRWMRNGFRILDYDNLLYPQSLGEEHFPTLETLLAMPGVKEAAKEKLKELKEKGNNVHPDVYMHWCKLAEVKIDQAVIDRWYNWLDKIRNNPDPEAKNWGKVIK